MLPKMYCTSDIKKSLVSEVTRRPPPWTSEQNACRTSQCRGAQSNSVGTEGENIDTVASRWVWTENKDAMTRTRHARLQEFKVQRIETEKWAVIGEGAKVRLVVKRWASVKVGIWNLNTSHAEKFRFLLGNLKTKHEPCRRGCRRSGWVGRWVGG